MYINKKFLLNNNYKLIDNKNFKKYKLMKKKVIKKRKYIKPSIEKIKIDKNISMVMMSTPPGDPTGMLGSVGSVFK